MDSTCITMRGREKAETFWNCSVHSKKEHLARNIPKGRALGCGALAQEVQIPGGQSVATSMGNRSLGRGTHARAESLSLYCQSANSASERVCAVLTWFTYT